MKLASFKAGGGASYGVVIDAGVIDVGRNLKARYPTLRAVLAAQALPEIARAAQGAKPDLALDRIEWLPPITDPDKIICIGLNYKQHAAETGAKLPAFPS